MYITDLKVALIAAFNTANKPKVPLQVADVDFVNPRLQLLGSCNAAVTLRAKLGSMTFKGTQDIHYNRVRIDTVCRNVVIPGRSTDYASTHAVIAVLRKNYGLPIDLDDIDYAVVPQAATLTLRPKVASLGYLFTSSAIIPFEY
jgi:hypothetical protein